MERFLVMGGGEDLALGRRLGRVCVLADDEDDDEEEEGERARAREGSSLNDIGDDALVCVLSFLSPRDIAVCSRVSQRLRGLCRDEDEVIEALISFIL